MWKAFAAVLLFVAPAFAQEENATAYEALRVVGTELGRGALNHVVAITGVKGNPQPKKWKIVLEDPGFRASAGSIGCGVHRRRNNRHLPLEHGFEWRV